MAIVNDRQPRDRTEQAIALSPALILYLLIMILLIAASFFLRGYRIITLILISEWVIIFVPCLVYLGLFRVQPRKELMITGISANNATGVILASFSGILLTGELVVWQNKMVPLPPGYLEILREHLAISGNMDVRLAVMAFAVSPAICEELLFRGLLLQGLVRKVSVPWAVILTGLLFGIFHLDLYRLLGTTVLGFIMGYVTIKARSLLAAMIYHLTNNLLVFMVVNTRRLQEIPWLMEEAHLPAGILIVSALTFIVSMKMIRPGSPEKVDAGA